MATSATNSITVAIGTMTKATNTPNSFRFTDLPLEIQDMIWEVAFAHVFKPTVLSFALCKGPRGTNVLGNKYELILQTDDIRILLGLCARTRAMVIRRKPHTITFATRRTSRRIRQTVRCGRLYPQGVVFTNERPGVVVFNGELDIIHIEDRQANSTFAQSTILRSGCGFQYVRRLHLHTEFKATQSQCLQWSSILRQCTALKQFHMSSFEFHIAPPIGDSSVTFRAATDRFFHAIYYRNQQKLLEAHPHASSPSAIYYTVSGYPLSVYMRDVASTQVPHGCEILPACGFNYNRSVFSRDDMYLS